MVAAVVGPTATGKTALGIGLARHFGGEIVSCDSMQIYRGLPIGTAQPDGDELAQAPHHLVNFLDVRQPFSVSDYVNLARQAIREIAGRGKLPILVGGTGLYARSLLRGFTFEERAKDDGLRQKLMEEAQTLGPDALYQRLQQLDPAAAGEIHPHNVKRVVRALEYIQLAGEPFSSQAARSKEAESPYRYCMVVLGYRDRQKLYQRIDSRVDKMLAAGLLEEAERFYRLCRQGDVPPTAAQAIGYKELFPYFAGEVSLEQAVEDIKRESRRYAKRQITWFAREENAVPLYLDEVGGPEEALQAAIELLEERGFGTPAGKEG